MCVICVVVCVCVWLCVIVCYCVFVCLCWKKRCRSSFRLSPALLLLAFPPNNFPFYTFPSFPFAFPPSADLKNRLYYTNIWVSIIRPKKSRQFWVVVSDLWFNAKKNIPSLCNHLLNERFACFCYDDTALHIDVIPSSDFGQSGGRYPAHRTLRSDI